MNYLKIIALLFLLIQQSIQVYGKEQDRFDTLTRRIPSKFYSQLSIGLTNPLYRDFATSPLFYRGLGIVLNTAWLKRSEKRERNFRIDLAFGSLFPRIPKSNYIQPGGLALMGHLSFYHHQLWKLNVLSASNYHLKVGSALIITQNIRINSALENNAIGIENISNVMASAQITRDISRKEPKEFYLFKLKPVKRELRFLINVGILNFNYRPGYAYAYDSELNGTNTNPVAWAFSNYKLSMNGWRINTQLEFSKYLANGNARAWSYLWEAAHAKGKFEPFQMASHRILFTLYFHSKEN
jgi:hypothetical protein